MIALMPLAATEPHPHRWVTPDALLAQRINGKRPDRARVCEHCQRPKIDEATFRAQIVNPSTKRGRPGLADQLGWEHVGWRPAQTVHGFRTPGTGTMAKGWPDLTLVHPRTHRLILLELKGDGGKLDHEQERVLGVLRLLPPPVEVYVFWPDDLERVAAVLMP